MFRDFLAFLITSRLTILQVNTIHLLAFMEFLAQQTMSSSNIVNYMAAIRAMYILHGLSTAPFKDDRLSLFAKSMKINTHFSPTIRTNISTDMLLQIVQSCDKLRDPTLFKSLYLFSFFSFLRMSNILPHSAKLFDISRHLTRGDLIFAPESCTIIVKWSKTNQTRKNVNTISIPYLGASPLCPIAALKRMFKVYPGSRNDPLFMVWAMNSLVPLSDSTARKHLKKVSSLLATTTPLTFHAFRRAGTTWAFQKGVPLEQIMKHGTWSSDAVWRYVQSVPSAVTPVSSTFQRHLRL